MQNHNFTQTQIDEYVHGIEDVKVLIYKIINGEYVNTNPIQPESIPDTMRRQVNHLQLMLGIQAILDSGVDVVSIEIAIQDGMVWLQNNQ